MRKLEPLTRRQREMYDFIGRFKRTHGFAPSMEEIAVAMGLRALATIHKHLTNLEKRGYIRRQWNRSRSIELAGEPGCCPTCGRELEQAKVDADFAMKTDSEGVELKAVEFGTAIPRST